VIYNYFQIVIASGGFDCTSFFAFQVLHFGGLARTDGLRRVNSLILDRILFSLIELKVEP
jgi:hypothetical protein